MKPGYIDAKKALLAGEKYTTTGNVSLDNGQIKRYTMALINGAHKITLPAAAAANAGQWLLVASNNAGGSLYVAAGFSGAGASYATITLTQGEACFAWSDGTNWYATTPAAVPA